VLECLASLASGAGSHQEAARLFGAAEAFRQRIGLVRFLIHQAAYEASVVALREAMGEQDFEAAWAQGAALSTEEAIAYAQRGRGTQTTGHRLGIAHPRRARRRPTGQRGTGQQRHRHTAFRLAAHRTSPPHARLHQTRPDLAGANWPKRRLDTEPRCQGLAVSRLVVEVSLRRRIALPADAPPSTGSTVPVT
jgi:hypothetical protein